jgi:hypothetical protein
MQIKEVIPMTKIFCAILQADIVPYYYNITGQKMRVLISYFYIKGQMYKLAIEYKDIIEELYLDCGAFSAKKGNILLTESEHRKYIHMFGQHVDYVFTLDNDFENPDHNFNNVVFLEKGLPENFNRPIPVIHDLEDPLGEIEIYVDQGYDYIAVGSNKKLDDDTLYEIKDKHPDLKLHMFGNLNRKMLYKHKPYSADSATWAHNAGYGSINYWHPGDETEYNIYLGEMENTDDKRFYFNTFKHKRDLEEHLHNEFKFEYEDLLKNTYNKWVVNLHYYRQLEELVNASK